MKVRGYDETEAENFLEDFELTTNQNVRNSLIKEEAEQKLNSEIDGMRIENNKKYEECCSKCGRTKENCCSDCDEIIDSGLKAEEKLIEDVATKAAIQASLDLIDKTGNSKSSKSENTVKLTEEEFKITAEKEAIQVLEKIELLDSLSSQAKLPKTEKTVELEEEKEENQVLVDFASLTTEELETTFGDFKPCFSLNPYMVKLGSIARERLHTYSFLKITC